MTVERAYAEHAGWEVLMRRLADDGFLELNQEAIRALLSDPAAN